MRIGIDIDGVLTNMEEALLDYTTKFCYENNIEYNIDTSKYYEGDMFAIAESDVEKFWNEYLGIYAQEYPIRAFSKEVINKLKENHEIYIITARNEEGLPRKLYGTMQDMVKNWLTKNEIEYDKLIFNGEKLKVCIENNIDVMVDDSPKNIYEISTQIPTICFDAKYNQEVTGENITRAYSWYDVLNKIEKMEEISNNNL